VKPSKPHSDLLTRARGISTATLHEAAAKTGALPTFIKPLTPTFKVCGTALPVRNPKGDNLWLHRAIYAAAPGEVLVVDTGEHGREFGYWGEVMAVAAQCRSIAGLVITGGIRDSIRLIEMNFPVFAGAVCIQGTVKDPLGAGTIGAAITVGNVRINHGDIIVGDADGVVSLDAALAPDIISKAQSRDREEQHIFQRLKNGETTLAIYSLPLHSKSSHDA
jgi:4-hydroxy-4-methyl-2-oxoglutarate aldolase